MFAILFEVLLIEIQEEIHHFAGWEAGLLRGTKIVNQTFVNKLAFPNKEKHININKFAGLSRDWVGAKILFMCFFRVIPYGGEKRINKVPPEYPGTIP